MRCVGERQVRLVTDLWETLRSARSALADDVGRLAGDRVAAIVERLDAQPAEVDGGALDAAADHCRTECLDGLLAEPFVARAAGAVGVEEPDRQLLAFDLRQAAGPLRVQPPEPVLIVRGSFLVIAAALGTVLGMMGGAWFCALLRMPADQYELARAIGAMVGAALFVAGGSALAHHDRLRKTIQWMLGIAALGIGATEVLGWLNPAGALWRALRGGGGGRWTKLKAFVLCIAMVILLQLARPIRRTDRDRLRAAVESAVRAWLAAHLDLMTLLLALQKDGPVEGQRQTDRPGWSTPILESLRKLSAATTDEERSALAGEVLQECRNAGLVFETDGAEGVFDESLNAMYEVVGLIRPGDAYRELEPPVREGDRVVVKGRITRKRTA